MQSPENATETKAPALRPEQRARVRIDAQLADAGWHVCDRDHFTSDRNAVALTEGLLNGNLEADYLLFLDGKIVGVLEAKRPDIDLEQAAGEQAVNYTYEKSITDGINVDYQVYRIKARAASLAKNVDALEKLLKGVKE